MKFKKRRLMSLISRNQKGQVALFVALIFQLLFLFFAMVINVGLLVHHKINLQNSVDLAAYYGAMKQAEMLNAMAHVNYQIRQSWKLVTWRYRVIGTGGIRNERKKANVFECGSDCANGTILGQLDIEGLHPDNQVKDYLEVPSFCATYAPFAPTGKEENLCKFEYENGTSIQLFNIPDVKASFINLASITRQFTQRAKEVAINRCKFVGPYNYSVLANMVAAFNFDQLARRLLIAKMAKGLSLADDDFYDLNGDSAKLGIENTLKNNLTDANRETLQYEVLNGLRQGDCFGSPAGEFDAPAWLSEVPFYPPFIYSDSECVNGGSGVGSVGTRPKRLDQNPTDLPNYRAEFRTNEINAIKPFMGLPDKPFQYTMGYEKNPWCMAYVGVKAVTKPKIPFAPATFELRARGFAKPFGGRFGPWFFSVWPSTSNKSMGGNDNRVDELIPPRLDDPTKITNVRTDLKSANYSRFVGDKLGLMSLRPWGQYVQAVHKSQPLHLDDWDHLFQPPAQNRSRDVLAWNEEQNSKPPIREVEAAAIAPDQFDITYYSIDPNFYENYFQKIERGQLLQKIGYNWPMRSDIGSRFESPERDLEKFSVKDQIEIVKRFPADKIDFDQKVTQAVKDPFHLLTSWVSEDLLNYKDVPEKYFGKCLRKVADISQSQRSPYPGDCVLGGRTGYSVKTISMDYLQSQLELGGAAAGKGKIKNAPDPSW